MSTRLNEQYQDVPPEGYIDIIMIGVEAALLEEQISARCVSLRDVLEISQMPGLGYPAASYPLQASDADLVRYRYQGIAAYSDFIDQVISPQNITSSSPQITTNAKAHFSKKICSIVYFDTAESDISDIIPEFQACEHSDFTAGSNNSKFSLKTGAFSPFDISRWSKKEMGLCARPDNAMLYCSNDLLFTASMKFLMDEGAATTPYELILTSAQLMRLRIELDYCQPLTYKPVNGVNVYVVCVNLTARQAKAYQKAFDLVLVSQPNGVPLVQCSRAHPAISALSAVRQETARQTALARRACCSFFTPVAPIVGFANTLWALNYLSPAFHHMLPSALSMILSASVTPYVLVVLTVLLIAAICYEHAPVRDDVAETSFNMC